MSASIEGKQVAFGISSAVKSTADDILTGIVQSASASRSINETEVQDEDGDHVAVIYHGKKNEISVDLIALSSSVTTPTPGSEVTFPAGVTSIDGIAVGTGNGRAFITSSSSSQTGASTTTVSFTMSHYPDMEADA